MNIRQWFCIPLLPLGLAVAAPTAWAQTAAAPRIVTCDTTVAPRSALRVQDEASGNGVEVEDVALITLPNGMRSVQFSVRHARMVKLFGEFVRVRYTVQWTDDCGRRITNGTQVVDGPVLNPQQQQLVQSTAMDPHATHAFLRIYVEN